MLVVFKTINNLMKTYTQFKEDLNRNAEYQNAQHSPLFFKLKVNDVLIKPSIHASSQAVERRPDLTKTDWAKMHQTAVKYLVVNKYKSGDYVIFSKSLEQGYVIEYSTLQKLINIITCLPKGKSTPKEGTRKLVVEGVEMELIIIE